MCVSQVRLGFDDTRTLLKTLDSDNDGTIDYREFARYLRRGSSKASDIETVKSAKPVTSSSLSSSSAATTISLSDRVRSELCTKFDAAIDSGKISSYEDVFKAMDKDSDGHISRQEFEDGLRDLRVRVVCLRE